MEILSLANTLATNLTGSVATTLPRHPRRGLRIHPHTQVRAFSAALFRPYTFEPNRRDAWWTLLSFYNSLRELGGAKTLFDSDIRSRLKFMFNREGLHTTVDAMSG